MSHIHTKPGQHDHTVSMFIVRSDGPEPRIMFHYHLKYRVYMHFGGHVELNEDPWRAAVRELKEEAGYDSDQLMILQPKDRLKKLRGGQLHPVPIASATYTVWGHPGHLHDDAAYAFVTSQEPRHKLSARESADIKLFNRAELIALPADQTYENGREIALYILDNALKNWESLPASA